MPPVVGFEVGVTVGVGVGVGVAATVGEGVAVGRVSAAVDAEVEEIVNEAAVVVAIEETTVADDFVDVFESGRMKRRETEVSAAIRRSPERTESAILAFFQVNSVLLGACFFISPPHLSYWFIVSQEMAFFFHSVRPDRESLDFDTVISTQFE